MSEAVVHSIGTLAAETAVEAAWAQWGALTTAAAPAEQPRLWTIVDPEALVLLSLSVRERERRLDDLLAGWTRVGLSLLSVQRLRTLSMNYPAAVGEQVPAFARYAADAGDRRWQRYAADGADPHGFTPRDKGAGPLRLVQGPALMLRLRAGIGVGAKADLLTFLLGLGGAAAGLKAITTATAYSDRAMRTAAGEMALAGFIHEVDGPPNAYRADPAAWAHLLEGIRPAAGTPARPSLPPWRFWSVAFEFLTAVVSWERTAQQERWSAYVASSRARDLVDTHRRRLRHTAVAMTGGTEARGVAYLDSFRSIVERVCAWTHRSLWE